MSINKNFRVEGWLPIAFFALIFLIGLLVALFVQ
jgi:hypothetical protein